MTCDLTVFLITLSLLKIKYVELLQFEDIVLEDGKL